MSSQLDNGTTKQKLLLVSLLSKFIQLDFVRLLGELLGRFATVFDTSHGEREDFLVGDISHVVDFGPIKISRRVANDVIEASNIGVQNDSGDFIGAVHVTHKSYSWNKEIKFY